MYFIGMEMRIDKVSMEFLISKLAARYSEKTITSYESILHSFREYTGHNCQVETIDEQTIERYLASMKSVKDKTVYNHHICLSSFWTWMVEKKIVEKNVVRNVKSPKVTKYEIVPYTEDEVRRILAATRTPRDRAIILVLIDTGLRASELCALDVEDWRDGKLLVMGKGKKERFLPLSEETEKALYHQLAKRIVRRTGIDAGSAMFETFISRKHMTYTTLQTLMRRLKKYSGVNDVHCHRFRHTFAINFLRNKGDIFTLQKILGHSNLETVKLYLNIAKTDIEEAHAKASPVNGWGLKAYG
jgi:integrase/recombinase XerD